MSDTGKVLVDSSGRPLKSPDGKIVLADRLYPYSLAQVNNGTRTNWSRSWSSADMTQDGVLAVDWESGAVQTRRTYWPSYQINTATNMVYKFDLVWEYENYPALSVPWAQIQPLGLSYEITFQDMVVGTSDYANPQNVNGYVWYSWADQDDPSGHEEVWLRDDWFEMRMGKPQNDGSARVLSGSVTIPKSPTPPAQLWVAEFFDAFSPNASLYGTDGFSCDVTLSLSWPGSVTYNLAT